MPLAVRPPLRPMLCRPVSAIPPGMSYEPKWDGYRTLVFRDGDEVSLLSRNGRDLTGYFPDVVEALLANTPPRCVLDGELIVVDCDRLDFMMLAERIHPATKRVAHLASTVPAAIVVWDVLGLDSRNLMAEPFVRRRALLETALANADAPVFVTPATRDLDEAQRWFEQFEGAGLDGVVAKPLDGAYLPDQRAMFKVKHLREADVVVGGFRLHQRSGGSGAGAGRPLLGSLQLGLFDAAGELHWVGAVSAFSDPSRAELAQMLGELEVPTTSDEWSAHPWSAPQVPGGPRRPTAQSPWGRERDAVVHLIDPMLVCTITFDQLEGTRLRHTGQFVRWRPDRDPRSCTFDQLEQPVRFDLAEILAGG